MPFFFFAYVLMRSKDRFRKLFLLIGVMASLSAIVAAYQTTLSPAQLASWGPGYQALINPEKGSGRIYFSEGEARIRPPGLGSDAGASGAIGKIALPMCLALLVVTRRRRWIPALLCVGASIGVMVGLGRLPLIGALLGVAVFIALAATSGRRFSRTMLAMIAAVVIVIPAGAIVVLRAATGHLQALLDVEHGIVDDAAQGIVVEQSSRNMPPPRRSDSGWATADRRPASEEAARTRTCSKATD